MCPPTHKHKHCAPKHSGQDYTCAKQREKDISSQVLYTSLGLFVTASGELVSDFFSGPLGNLLPYYSVSVLTNHKKNDIYGIQEFWPQS